MTNEQEVAEMTLEQVLEQNGTTLDSIHGHYFSAISPDELETITKEIGSHDGTTIYEIESEHGKLWLAECRDGSAHVLCQDDLDQIELDKVDTVTVDLKAVLDRVAFDAGEQVVRMTSIDVAPAISINAEGEIEYDWSAIEQGAVTHSIDPAALKDYAFESVDVDCNVGELVQGYVNNKEADRATCAARDDDDDAQHGDRA